MRRDVKLRHVDKVYEDKCRVSQKILLTKIEICGAKFSLGHDLKALDEEDEKDDEEEEGN